MLMLLAWATIPIGSNRPWSVAILEFGALSILGSWCLTYTLNPFTLPSAARRARIPLVLMFVWVIYPLLQLVPLPASWVSALSLGHETPYRELLPGADGGFSYLTVDRNATLAGFLWQASLLAMFCCVLVLVTTVRRMRTLLTIMFLVGFFQALYGLAIYFGGGHLGIWNPGYSEGTVSGTYVNQNHFAGLMELTIPIGLGLLMYAGRDWRLPTESARFLPSILTFLSGKTGILLFCTLVMTAALILTTSRGGVGSLAVGVTVAILLAVAKRGMRTRETVLGVVITALTVTALIWIGPGKSIEKIETLGFASKRGDLRDISYQIISDRPVFGAGVGTYRWVFPTYKDDRFGGNFYEHAHNDFLEVIGEQGIMGFAFLASGVLIVFVRMVRTFWQTRDLLMRGALFAAMSGTMALLVHGLVDFNLHIPANALFFVVLLGIGAIACDMVGISSPDRGVSSP
jgi:O-antigen ligase